MASVPTVGPPPPSIAATPSATAAAAVATRAAAIPAAVTPGIDLSSGESDYTGNDLLEGASHAIAAVLVPNLTTEGERRCYLRPKDVPYLDLCRKL